MAKKPTVTSLSSIGALVDANKPAKPVWDAALIGRMAQSIVSIAGVDSIKETLAKDIKFLRDNKIKLGKSSRTCSICKEFITVFGSLGVKQQTQRNYLTALRLAVNDGKVFDLNPSRAASKTGKKSSGKRAAKTTWKTSGEVLEALFTAIKSVKDAAVPSLWADAMADAPEGFEEALLDFAEAQGDETVATDGEVPTIEPEEKAA